MCTLFAGAFTSLDDALPTAANRTEPVCGALYCAVGVWWRQFVASLKYELDSCEMRFVHELQCECPQTLVHTVDVFFLPSEAVLQLSHVILHSPHVYDRHCTA